jgi:hypothetical protein
MKDDEWNYPGECQAIAYKEPVRREGKEPVIYT